MRKTIKRALAIAMTAATMITGVCAPVSAAKLQFATKNALTDSSKLMTGATTEAGENSFIVEYTELSTNKVVKKCRYAAGTAGSKYTIPYYYGKTGWLKVRVLGRSKADKTVTKHMYYTAKAPKVTTAQYSGSKAKITWTKRPGSSGYYVYQSTDRQTWKKVAVKSSSSTSYITGSLALNKTYYYYVKAYKKIGSSTYTSSSPDQVRSIRFYYVYS